MSYFDRIAFCCLHDISAFRPFIIAGQPLGWVKDNFAVHLLDFPKVFHVTDEAVTLNDRLQSFSDRTEAVDEVLRLLHNDGKIEHWIEEKFPVKRTASATPVFDMERAAISLFGLPALGVHMNGYVGHGADMKMWVGERSHVKPIEPGKLDQLVAGGQPADLSIWDNLIKECAEEANIDAAMAEKAVSVGAITYRMEVPQGLRCDVLYNFDLKLDADFTPVNTDDEVHAFHLWPIDKVADIVHETDDFKFNCSLVVIDFLIRHGLITPDHPEYVECVKGLRS